MDFRELIDVRKSVRGFIDKEIADDIIMELLYAAQSAPSGGNCQPWHFYGIKDKSIISKIYEKACKQSFILTAPFVFVVCADIQRTIGRYGERGKELYCIQDTAAAIQNMLLCATNLNLGTCWCGAFDESAVKKILNLKQDMRPVAIIPVGYHNNTSPRPKRRPMDEIVTFL